MDFIGHDNYDDLTFCDIIWAKRYNNEKEMLNIPEKHREGPYIVIGREEGKLICVYGTSVFPRNFISTINTFQLTDPDYGFVKDTFVNLGKNECISQDRFVKKMGHLNMLDKKYFYKKIDVLKKYGLYKNIEIDSCNILLESGDIINKDYLILEQDDECYYCLKMHLRNNDEFYLKVNGIEYGLDFFHIKKIKKDTVKGRDDFVDDITLKKVLAMLKYKIEQNNRKLTICRGSLIRLNGIFYYVYGEIGNEWMLFSLVTNPKKNFSKIIINKKNYYTDFSDCINILKNQKGCEIISVASEYEMKDIQKQKKSFKKSNNNSILELHNLNTEITVGSIIKRIDNNELYIVIMKTGEELIVIKYDKYLNLEYLLGKLLVKDVIYVDSLNDFNLKKVLCDISGKTSGYINEKRLRKMIRSL